MPYELKGRRVLITGGARGLGLAIAEAFARRGASIAINFMSNKSDAERTASSLEASHGVKVLSIQADISKAEDCQRLVAQCVKDLGGIDVVIANAAWTEFSTFADLDALTEDKWDKCWATNVKSSLHLFKAASPYLNANTDGGLFLYTASTAGRSVSGSSMAYSVTKAAGLQLMRCLAQSQGPKVRVNSVVPGLLLTEWGKRYSEDFIQDWKEQCPIKAIPSLEDCAEIYVAAATNLSMTGQEIAVDCGWLLAH